MMECDSCQFDNPKGVKFCGRCGKPLRPVCPRCGAVAAPGFRFCGECGAPLDAPAAPPAEEAIDLSAVAGGRAAAAEAGEDAAAWPQAPPAGLPPAPAADGERKQVTVLHCELAAAELLSERLGAEELHALLGRIFALARDEAQRYGGSVNRFLDRGFVVVFGSPVAHEDHARRALLAAQGLARRLGLADDAAGPPDQPAFAVSMGAASGPVVVGGFGDLPVGEAPKIAAELASRATAGELLVAESTTRLLGDRDPLAAAAAAAGPGFYAVRLADAAPPASPAAAAAASPFVGRRRELAVLRELWRQAEAGAGQVVGITGEAGAGKSRLLHELWRSLGDRGRAVRLSGDCLSYTTGVPYSPFVAMLRQAAGVGETDAPEALASRLRDALGALGGDHEDFPYLLRLVGSRAESGTLADLGPQAIQARTFAALRRLVLDASRRGLVVVEIEDLQWIDETSEALLGSLVEAVGAARALVLLTYRSGYRPTWMDRSYATQIALRRLSPDDSRRVVTTILRRAGLADELASSVIEKGDGNPFFLEELARSLVEWGREDGDGVPDTITDLLGARIDRLPARHKRLLQTAAILGREFDVELLKAIWERDAPPEPLLEDLERWEFLYEAPSVGRPIAFKHVLTREVAYGGMLSGRRRELHKAAAAALETLYAGRLEEAYDQLTYHYPRAGDVEKTVHYLRLFAARAARGYAHAEAARALYEAIDQAQRLPGGDRERRTLDLALRLAESLLPLARIPETLELLEAQRERMTRIGDPALTARLLFWLAHTHSYLGHLEESDETARRAIGAAREAGDEATAGKASYVIGRNGFWAGRFDQGLESSVEAVVLLERSGEPWWQGQAYWVAGFNQFAQGRAAEALEAFERAGAIGEALEDPRLDTSWSAGYVHASLGRWETGIELCRSGLERSRDPLNTAAALGFLGFALLEKGETAPAIEVLEDSVRRLDQAGMQQLLGWFSTYLGEAYLDAGRLEEAAAAAGRGLEVSLRARFRFGAGLSHRALGRLALARAEVEEAAARLREALELFGEFGVPLEAARTDLDLARLEAARGDAAAARGRLAEARAAFGELGLPHYLERVDALERELGLGAPAA